MDIRRGHDALAQAVVNIRPHEQVNGHSWGIAWVDDDGVHIQRGVGTIPSDLETPVADAALAHTRFATKGDVTVANAHPFAIERNGEVVAALAHNGTWYNAPDIDGWSDTRAMAALLSSMLDKQPDAHFGDMFAELCKITGETTIALHRDGTCYIHSGRFPITRYGAVVSSSGQPYELEDGMHVITPGEEMVMP